ncbi:low affinity iron permease family protein, partial [Exiguobacterium sp. IPCH1]|uniref:low affinity iron permease family protein n=1 Tax=Exiguobacterium sp. IPCH1 TaxID=2510947 RepID=UPI0010E3A5FC
MIGKLKTDHRPGVFVLAGTIIIVWALNGPFLDFSDTWQLIINTLITFLMVFIIQNTQNRDGAAVHLKLDVIMSQLNVQDAGLYDAENRSEAED